MILGFAGSSWGMTDWQGKALRSVLATFPEMIIFVNGGAGTGEMFTFLQLHGMPKDDMELLSARASEYNLWRHTIPLTIPPQDADRRLRSVTQRCAHLLAIPEEAQQAHWSEVWHAIRFARQWKRPRTIVMPDGSILQETD